MSGNTFAVVFSGRIAEGASVTQVKSNVAKLFKVEVTKVERLFSGARVALKKGLDETTAKKYQMALAKAGALCEVVNVAAMAKKAPSPAVAAKPQKPARAASPAPRPAQQGSVGLTKSVVKRAPSSLGSLASVTLDQPGTVLVEHQEVTPLQVDLGGLSMDAPGATLSQHEEVAPPAVDTSALSVAEPGADLGKAETVAPLQVDIRGLSMDEPGATLVEHEEVPQARIDTSKFSVS